LEKIQLRDLLIMEPAGLGVPSGAFGNHGADTGNLRPPYGETGHQSVTV
jgi:hypothetical protein